jgi:hypothetical protein
MQRHFVALLLACATVSYGQSIQGTSTPGTQMMFALNAADSSSSASSSSANSSSDSAVINGSSAAPAYGTRQTPFGSLTEGVVYDYSPHQYGADRSLLGWAVVPEVNLVHHFGLQGDFEGLYMRSIYPSQNEFIAAAGPRFNLAPRSRVAPFLFVESGEVRHEAQHSHYVNWNPVVKGGFGFQYRMTQHFGVTLVPGEYLGEYQDPGFWTHSFTARFGFTFVLGGGTSTM